MTPTGLAPLPVGPVVRGVLLDLVLSLRHIDRLGLPERERVDRAGGPAPARLAMAVSGALRLPCDLDGDRAAVALPLVGLITHQLSPRSRSGRGAARAVSRNQFRVLLWTRSSCASQWKGCVRGRGDPRPE